MNKQVGTHIRSVRKARGISLRGMARELGIDHSHLSKIENAKDNPGSDLLVRIAELLDINPGLLLGEAGKKSMPFRVVGTIAAGDPIEAIEDVEAFDLSQHFDPRDHFLLRVQGDSMVNEGIHDGDLAVLRQAKTARRNQIVAAVVRGEDATLKRFRQERVTVVLTPENDDMEEISFPARDVEIRGVLAGVIRTSV